MEDFAAKEKKGIKEKNIYVLHLDTPRIIILTSVIIGLIIVSVLIGMNINKQDQRDNEGFAHENAVLDNLLTDNNEKTNSWENNNIEPPLNNENILNDQENKNANIIAENSVKPNDYITGAQENPQRANNPAATEQQVNNATDILTHENIETIIPPSNVIKKPEPKKSLKNPSEKKSDKTKETRKRKSVVEVSSEEKSYAAPDSNKSYFAIQVASFDKKSKALTEISNLENKKYSAYIDNARVNNKTFYRVMIGPIYSKKKALDLLDEISSNNRYEESYMIKK